MAAQCTRSVEKAFAKTACWFADWILNANSCRFEEQLAKTVAARRQGDADLRRQAAELERCIANQLRGLSDGYSPAITEEIAKLERQLATVREQLRASDPQAAKLQMRDARRFIEHRLRSLDALWEGDPRVAREEIAKHVQRITLRPMLRTYVATGVWDWLRGLEPAATMVVPGARIERIATSASPSRSRHKSFGRCERCL